MKRKWIYRGLLALFVLGLAPPTFGKITQNDEFLASFTGLGYPVYLTRVLLVAYLLGLVALFQTRFELLKEWAYAGFTFALSGAFVSHLLSGEASRGVWALVTLTFLLSAYCLRKKVKAKNGNALTFA